MIASESCNNERRRKWHSIYFTNNIPLEKLNDMSKDGSILTTRRIHRRFSGDGIPRTVQDSNDPPNPGRFLSPWLLCKRVRFRMSASKFILLLSQIFGLLILLVYLTAKEFYNDTGRVSVLSPSVCSHQLLNPPPIAPGTNPPPEGSLDALQSLFEHGIHCFDIDVVVLSDGSTVASHPRRLEAAISGRLSENNHQKIVVEEYSLESLRNVLGLKNHKDYRSSPFPLFDLEVLPRFAALVSGTPGAFASSSSSSFSALSPWSLEGPLLNIDLKMGRYLTKSRVLELAKHVHSLGLEDYVSVCVTDTSQSKENNDDGLDLLGVLHEYNTNPLHPRIPLGLVLRDMVPEDSNVDRIRKVVEELYPQSIRSLVPSFKFPMEWYQDIRDPDKSSSTSENKVWNLPMTVWTIDSINDYQYVESMRSKNGFSIASAVVANKPIELQSRLAIIT